MSNTEATNYDASDMATQAADGFRAGRDASFSAEDMATAAADGFRAGQKAGCQTNFDRVSAWLAAAGKEKNEQNVSLQAGCHLEEVAELLDCISIESNTGLTAVTLIEVSAVLKAIATNLKTGNAIARIYDREAALDALCDADVTGNGLAYLAGFDKNGADNEVLDSNDSKFNDDGTPVILPGGKIGKGQNYRAPNLTPFVGE